MTRSLRLALLCAGLGHPVAALSTADPEHPADKAAWTLSASAFAFFVPGTPSYLNPNLAAEHRGLHLEARYAYEALRTGSAWVGWRFAFGEALTLEITPMIGGVFGRLNGIAPGYLLTLGYGALALSSQGEYVFDAAGRAGDFLYTWSELGWSLAQWFRAGLAIQRTRAYATPLDVQRGLFAALSWGGDFEVAAYVFNPGWTTPTVVVALAGGG
jgi:hypothetical protein